MKNILDVKEGQVLKIECPIDCACRLRDMGICEGEFIENLGQCDPVLIKCGNTTIAVCKTLAEYIIIDDEDNE